MKEIMSAEEFTDKHLEENKWEGASDPLVQHSIFLVVEVNKAYARYVIESLTDEDRTALFKTKVDLSELDRVIDMNFGAHLMQSKLLKRIK